MLGCSFNSGQMSWSIREDWLSSDNGDQKDFHDSSCQLLPEFLLAGERRWVSWLSAVHPVLRTLTVNRKLQAPGLPKNEKKSQKRDWFAHRMWPWENKVFTLKKQLKKEQKPMKGGEPIIHCDRTSPLRLQLNPHREHGSVDKKVQIHLLKSGLPKEVEGKKAPEEPNTINSLLFRTFSPTKMFFLSSVFLWFDSPQWKLVPRMCNMKQKKQFTTTGKEGRKEKKSSELHQRGKKAWGLNLFSFCKLEEEKKRSFRCSLCL